MSGIEDIDPEIAALLGDTVTDTSDSETSVDAEEFESALPAERGPRDLDDTRHVLQARMKVLPVCISF